MAFRVRREGVGRESPSWRSSLRLKKQDNVEYNRSRCRHLAVRCILYLNLWSRFRVAWLGAAACANLCVWASYAPASELSPRAIPGFGVRVTDQLDQLRKKIVLLDFYFDAS